MNLDGITLSDNGSDPVIAKSVIEGLRGYNRTFIGDSLHTPVVITAHDDDGKLIGGILGEIGREWLFVAVLWVYEESRHQGLGSRLLQAAEVKAMAEGATRAHLDTFTFQAPDFYGRHGYEEFGRIKEYASGHDRIYLVKQLSAGSGVAKST